MKKYKVIYYIKKGRFGKVRHIGYCFAKSVKDAFSQFNSVKANLTSYKVVIRCIGGVKK